jgi:hypothetical protein
LFAYKEEFIFITNEKGIERLLIALYEPLDGAIVGLLHVFRKEASRKFTHAPVITDALTALPLPAAGLISTRVELKIILNITFFNQPTNIHQQIKKTNNNKATFKILDYKQQIQL